MSSLAGLGRPPHAHAMEKAELCSQNATNFIHSTPPCDCFPAVSQFVNTHDGLSWKVPTSYYASECSSKTLHARIYTSDFRYPTADGRRRVESGAGCCDFEQDDIIVTRNTCKLVDRRDVRSCYNGLYGGRNGNSSGLRRTWNEGLEFRIGRRWQSNPLISRRPTSASSTMQGERADVMRLGLPTLEDGQQQVDGYRRGSIVPDGGQRTEFEILMANYIPVYVMLPLDCVKRENVLSYPDLLLCNLRALKAAGVDGVMVDVWWGIVEGQGPKRYDWSAYKTLFEQIKSVGLKIQVVMSFHQCGGNTGDSCYIPLPAWVLEEGEKCADMFFTNQDGQRNREYLSFGIDEEPVLKGRTGVQVYYDFMKSFRDNLSEFLEAGLVTEVEVGLGPAGELRYPSYPETHGWRFPGIGEFQCYDKFLLTQLQDAANSIGRFEWGLWGPHDAGRYNDWPEFTGFFGHHGSFSSDYGRFFLEWYSTVLLKHGDRILEAASDVFVGCNAKLAAKVAGVHWWYNSKNHAAELAAGYYNLRERDGYRPIAKMLARHSATLNFTCVEMRNNEQYWEARCGPEGLVQQVLNAGWQEGVEVACENALPRYDVAAFDQIVRSARPDGLALHGPPRRRTSAFTFLRLGPDLLQDRNWNEFVRFVRNMHAGLDYHPEPEQFYRPRSKIRHSKPVQAMGREREERNTPIASVPLNVSSLPLSLSLPSDSTPFFSPDAPGGGLGVQVGEIPPPPAPPPTTSAASPYSPSSPSSPPPPPPPPSPPSYHQ